MSWLLLASLVSLLSGDTVQPEHTYSFILKVTGQVWESQKKEKQQHPKPCLNWFNNKVRFSFNEPHQNGVWGWPR